MQLSNTFVIAIDKDVVRRILAEYYKPKNNGDGPSWLSFLASTRYSLWSIDFFRFESITLKSYWVMVLKDQFSRKIFGFAVNYGDISGNELCFMFNSICSNKKIPKRLSTDNAPLFNFSQWQANLKILDIENIKSVPYTPISHPYIERLIQTVRQEYLDKLIVWNESDLVKKLNRFRDFYNANRCHYALEYATPEQKYSNQHQNIISIDKFKWKKYCNGLFELPVSA
jgi:putative transposase